MKKAAIGGLVIALIAGVVFLVKILGGGTGGTIAVPDAGPTVEADSENEVDLSGGDGDGSTPLSSEGVADRTEVTAPPRAASSDPWDEMLAGLTGRIIEEDGEPVVGIEVTLAGGGVVTFFNALGGGMANGDPMSIEVDSTKTDKEGRFWLHGASSGDFHGLGIDLGGPRAMLRVLENGLHHREIVDVGDIVLSNTAVLTGRVIDESGAPVAGARIRVAPVPAEIFQAGVQHVGPKSKFAVLDDEFSPIIEGPEWAMNQIDRLPIPTALTNRDGEFRVECAAELNQLMVADKLGFVAATRDPKRVEKGEQDVGEFVLEGGRVVTGHVVDEEGEPVVGAEVCVGAEVPFGEVAILNPAGVSAVDGSFRISGVPKTGQVVASARRAPSDAWYSVVSAGMGDQEIELESAFPMMVKLRNTAGEPVTGGRVRVVPSLGDMLSQGGGGVLKVLLQSGSGQGESRFVEVEPGDYLCSELTPGNYTVVANAPEYAELQEDGELWSGEAEMVMKMTGGRTLEIRVTDAATGEPVEFAQCSVQTLGFMMMRSLAQDRTSSDGKVVLGPFAVPEAPESSGFFRGENEVSVMVMHPDYGRFTQQLGPQDVLVEAKMGAGGTVVGKIHLGGEAPTKSYMIMMEPEFDRDGTRSMVNEIETPRIGLSDLEGNFKITQVTPGDWELHVFERFLDRDVLGMIEDEPDPLEVFRHDIVVEASVETPVDVDLTPSGMGPTARVEGRILVNGRPIAGAEVNLNGNGQTVIETDSSGSFSSGEISAMRGVWVRIEADLTPDDGQDNATEIYQDWVELNSGEVKRIDFDLQSTELRVIVVDAATRERISGANLNARFTGSSENQVPPSTGTTDNQGMADMALMSDGDWMVTASHSDYASTNVQATASGGGLSEIEIELTPPIPCKGRVDAGGRVVQEWGYLWVNQVDGEGGDSTNLEGADMTFSFNDLGPGKYNAQLWIDGESAKDLEFELGPDGDENLILRFEFE